MDINIDSDLKSEMENWPVFGPLSRAIIAAAPKEKRINLYLEAGKEKTMVQITDDQAKYLMERLSECVDHIARGVQ